MPASVLAPGDSNTRLTASLDFPYYALMPAFLATPIPLDANGVHSILIWSGILIALLLAAFGGYSYLKRWMNDVEAPDRGGDFTLAGLRELHKQGKISTEEYEKTRAQMVAAAKRMTEKLPEVTPRRPVPAAPGEPTRPPTAPS